MQIWHRGMAIRKTIQWQLQPARCTKQQIGPEPLETMTHAKVEKGLD
jgi:hypothetical protein